MKTKYPSMFGLLAALLLVVSFVLPTNVMAPQPVEADPGIMKWDTLITPGYLAGKNDIAGPLNSPATRNEILDMAVGGDGATILLTSRAWANAQTLGSFALTVGATNLGPAILAIIAAGLPFGADFNLLYYSNNGGVSFTSSPSLNFVRDFARTIGAPNVWNGELMYHVAIAPDDPKFWAVTTDNATFPNAGPQEVWITTNAGGKWERTGLALTGSEFVRTIDISADYGGKRDIAVGTVNTTGTVPVGGRILVLQSTGFTGWQAQNNPVVAGLAFDIFAVKFSPTYASDAALAAVFADNATSTWYNLWLRDINSNTTPAWPTGFAFTGTPPGIEVRDPTWTAGDSPSSATLNKADLELPSDFSGQAASLRRAYISLDAWAAAGKGVIPNVNSDGIFRIDDTTQYTLMDTRGVVNKSIYSIAYFGTYASGKLLAGERMGFPCTATVPTWFTDSPTTCPIPCWYPALKPTTGAAAVAGCATTQTGPGGAIVGWRADGVLAFVATGSLPLVFGSVAVWAAPWRIGATVGNDESAFALSRNNGETWNQIALIDTSITQITDMAPTADCKTVYLASVNTAATCTGFDSVWRSSSNSEVVAPLPAVPVGLIWERILTRLTAPNCTVAQTNVALLRLVPYCADPSGQIVGWGVYDTAQLFATGIAMWSPDYGDYWASINPRNSIQDFAFESATVLYFLSPGCLVQKMPYTGTAWGTTLANIDGRILTAHTIAAYPEGKVLVGSAATTHGAYYTATYSSNFNTDNPSFGALSMAGRTPFIGDVHVAFDPKFKDNNTIFVADEAAGLGSVYRNNPTAQVRWADSDMMAAANGAIGCPLLLVHGGIFGLVLAHTGSALYAADGTVAAGVWRTIDDGTGKYGPLSGMPKPGIAWDQLAVFVTPPVLGVAFTLEPSSLKICGCCTLDSDSTLYAIDNSLYNPGGTASTSTGVAARRGMVWAYTDCLAKKGPKLITADKTLIGCDPVSGRAQEVNLCWEQLCIADHYDIEIAKSAEFTIKIIDWVAENVCAGTLAPADVTQPCVYFPAGGAVTGPLPAVGTIASAIAAWGNLECGHTYYWRVKVRISATTQVARSPWSEVRSFTIKAGLPVSTPYYGVQLLAPNNGGLGIPVKPVSFSWSPFKETTKYKFVLAKDAAMTQVVKEADVTTTAFEYDGTLEYSSNYFWRVQSVEPAPSDWSATFSFLTEAAPAAAPGPTPAPPTPVWVWVVIALGAILVIVTLVLIFKTRRV